MAVSCITWRPSSWKRRLYILTAHNAGQVAWAYERFVRNATCICSGWNVAIPTAGHGYAARRDLLVHGESPSYKPRLEGRTGRTHSDKWPCRTERGIRREPRDDIFGRLDEQHEKQRVSH